MKGRQILIEPLPRGGHAAALVVDGRLQDLLMDQDSADPRPEAIYRATAGRPMKGLGGVMVDLGGISGFLRSPNLPAPGRPLLVQVAAWAEPGKAPLVSARISLKGRTVVLTPDAPGLNVSRNLRNHTRSPALLRLAGTAMVGADPSLGLILRSAAFDYNDREITAELAALRAEWEALPRDGVPGLLRGAPGAAAQARRDWPEGGEVVREGATALADAGVWEEIDALRRPEVSLGHGWMAIEPTRAMVAVDVNTGGDVSPSAALKANLGAAAELPRQLRLRGLGGQVVVDFAPLARADRPRVERALTAALRSDGIETTLAGWTPLGHLELRRKRARRPL